MHQGSLDTVAYALARMRSKTLIRWPLRRIGYVVMRTPRPLIDDRSGVLTPSVEMLLSHLGAKVEDPTFAVIGAFDGEQGDPVMAHAIASGWTGVAIEPQRAVHECLRSRLADSETITTICAAVGPVAGRQTLYKAAPDAELDESPDWRHQLASLRRTRIEQVRRDVDGAGSEEWEEQVDVITFDDVLARSGMDSVDVIQIDTEGDDWEILRTIDLARVEAKLVIYEHKHLSWSDREAAISHLLAAGFRTAAVTARDTAAMKAELV